MPISFTGFKNASTIKIVNPETPEQNYMYSMTMQLTDDRDGNELSAFKAARAKAKSVDIPPLTDDRFVNISLVNDEYGNESIIINQEKIEPADDTLGLFSFVGKLMNKVRSTPEENFRVSKNYIMSQDYDDMVVPGYNLREALGSNYYSIAKDFALPANVKSQADDIFEGVQDIMMDYLA